MKTNLNFVKSLMAFALTAVLLLCGVVTAFAAEQKVSVTFDSKGGSMVSTMQGAPGAALNIPKSKREGYVFAGWYNKSGDKLFTDTVFPSKNTELYAKWDIRGVFAGFENVEAFAAPNSISFTVRCKLSNDDASSGTTSLLYDYNVIDDKEMALATVSFIDDCGLSYKFENNKNYILTFKYKVVSVSKPGNFGVISSGDGTPWKNRIEQVRNRDEIGYTAEDIGKGWQTKTIKFSPKDMQEDAEFFGFAISGCGKLYVDDVLIRIDDEAAEYKGHVIEFESNGGAFVPPVYGKMGDSITVPQEIEKEGFNFIGWYADKDLIAEFEEKTIVRANTTVYADWFIKSKPQAPNNSTVNSTEKNESNIQEGNGQQTIVPNTSKPSDDKPTAAKPFNMTTIYIVAAAIGAVVVAGAVVAVVIIVKGKAKAKEQNNQEAKDNQEAK